MVACAATGHRNRGKDTAHDPDSRQLAKPGRTMTARWMYDAAVPPARPPHWYAVAGYIGGDTPHVWTAAEWAAQLAPHRLPIWTADNRLNSPASAAADAPQILAKLEELGVPPGVTVALDGETRIFPAYLEELNELVRPYLLMDYGSLSFVTSNPVTSGGRWAADWTDRIADGVALLGHQAIAAVQWADDVARGTPYDWSVIQESVPLWRAA
jgi:hypothetical protein